MARDANGDRLFEELMGTHGFSAESALLYHRRSPSALVGIEATVDISALSRANHPLTPLHLLTRQVEVGDDMVTGRVVMLANKDVSISLAGGASPSPLYRDAIGDQVVFVHEGTGRFESIFGALDVGPGDYVVIPTSTTHRWVPTGDTPLRCLVIAAGGHVGVPAKYLTPNGQFLEGSPYCERDLRAPTAPLVVSDDELDQPTDVIVQTRGGRTVLRNATHPFDVVAWDGALYPYALSIYDFEPIVGSLHQPPPIHQTFAGPGFVICSFVPRPLDFHPDAVKVPYHHANVDSDEVLFYAAGDFTSRKGSGVDVGSITLHPSGFVHGPQPGSWEASVDATRTDELAVMIDTFAPLLISDDAAAVTAADYPMSWR